MIIHHNVKFFYKSTHTPNNSVHPKMTLRPSCSEPGMFNKIKLHLFATQVIILIDYRLRVP
jgi:hypothetical protein